jgi:molybdopterin/thiamine biosynthesis adenylyltransferase
MPSITLVVPGDIADRLRELAGYDIESAGVLLIRRVETDRADIRLLARQFIEVPDGAYERREAQQMLIRSEGFVPALAAAEKDGCIPVWVHTHPGAGSSTEPSLHDNKVNELLAEPFRVRADTNYYGALIVGHNEGGLRFTGLLDDGMNVDPIDRLWISGPRLALYHTDGTGDTEPAALFDRNIRAFGGSVQRVLGDLRVAVVGCGGTGSAVVEQLVRLGVRDFVLVDPDDLSKSNVTRVYGSRLTDVGRAKVDVLADHVEDVMGPEVTIRRITSTITARKTACALLGADILFGCTDDNAGRLVLSRLSSFMLTPVIDCGVLLSSDAEQHLDGIHGRVTVLHPGQACLVCRDRIDISRASSELLTPSERVRLVAEGYAQALPGVEPAVVAYTTAVAATAVAELLERLTHYGVEPVPSEILLRLHDREISTNNAAPRPRHYCDPAAGKLGLGLTEPFLEQTWQD